MLTPSEFKPNWASPPGDTIRDLQSEQCMPTDHLARALRLSVTATEDLIAGRIQIDTNIAIELERLFGASGAFWLRREEQFRADLERIEAEKRLKLEKEWVRQLPLRDMIRFGWISPPDGRDEAVESCLSFFGVPDVESWHRSYHREISAVAFRNHSRHESHPAAVAAWLRQAELSVSRLPCGPWDPDHFRALLTTIRGLTKLKRPVQFVPRLQNICAQAGVAVAVVRAPEGCRASGATKFLKDGRAHIVVSFRFRSDDQFWFTFFHEAGHVVLHDKKALFLEDESESTEIEEHQANQFSQDTLIPPPRQCELHSVARNVQGIVRLATSLGISPGIVVGQMQHRNILRMNQLNNLKRRYTWDEVEETAANPGTV